jgi:hypothetical protein
MKLLFPFCFLGYGFGQGYMDLGDPAPKVQSSLFSILIPLFQPSHGGDAHECDEATNQS